MIGLAPDAIDPATLLAEFTLRAGEAGAAGAAGAIVSFSGIVRPDDGVNELWLDHHERMTLRAIMRASADDGPLEAAIARAMHRKPRGHDFVIGRAPAVARHMSATGG